MKDGLGPCVAGRPGGVPQGLGNVAQRPRSQPEAGTWEPGVQLDLVKDPLLEPVFG